ncbi:MAG: hypothetical protein A3H98_10715 [Bacteroidetes bacterium RIFCSPLOWO2_02_FULL_36_8]|nr:MAG: hypothetical protein A3H98_10715 [Bacteroidetes bacterium RIFCSPLOWO2_02_FULL_36_8]OFY69771.1 MAG: hypothetical protein A3G23_11500 [Bacteroidetes bacterium RIFCSPLOWO2_12_FULL_37_12]
MAYTEHYYTQFETGCFYHVYNRAVDSKPMFKNEGNYLYFLRQYGKYLSSVLDTFAYCLLGNHFHLLVRVRDPWAVGATTAAPPVTSAGWGGGCVGCRTAGTAGTTGTADLTTFQKLSNLMLAPMPAPTPTSQQQSTPPKTTHDIVSHQFRKFFQSYSMAFNKQQDRIGTLFQTPFKRALVDGKQYLRYLVYYIHANPQLHGITEDFRDWKWNSYHSILSDEQSKIKKAEVLNWFNDKETFQRFHDTQLMNFNKEENFSEYHLEDEYIIEKV